MRAACSAIACGYILICGVSRAQQPETAQLIDSIQGPALYNAYCAVCHGTDGKGNGPLARVMRAAPPNLRRLAARNGGKFPEERVQNIVGGKEAVPGGHGTREMPVWGPIFSQIAWDQDLGRLRVYNLTKYLESIQAK